MRRKWNGLRWLVATTLLGLVGCWTTDQNFRPPPQPEQYVSPPAGEARYFAPPAFPKETLNQGMIKSSPTGPGGAPKMPNRFGSGAGGGAAGGY